MQISNKRNDAIFMSCQLVNKTDLTSLVNIDLASNAGTLAFDKNKYNYEWLYRNLLVMFKDSKQEWQINLDSFLNDAISDIDELVMCFTYSYHFVFDKQYNLKKDYKDKKHKITLFTTRTYNRKKMEKAQVIAKNISEVKELQVMPPNICTSEYLAKRIVDDFNKMNLPHTTGKFLNKKEMEKLGMNLLLGVNKGSSYEPRLVVLEYTPKPVNKQKTVYVGKGITFDSGGYNIKTGKYMLGMKFDMSGAAIMAGTLKSIAMLNGKQNVACVLAITDNRLDGDAITPDMVIKAMNGMHVEIENTDAEGRLVLSDALTYAAKELKATTIIDAATLTGSVLWALGTTFSGVWSTDDKKFEKLWDAAQVQHELIWRMPMHEDFDKKNLETDIADIKNCSETTLSDSNDAAMYLKHFVEKVDYIHCDIAGTAEIDGKPTAALLKTFTEFGL
ncbi:Cytosol aminopeptidase [Mycoplasmopsis californica]|uniref:Probable cytosol aminopeptidase n=1 Tax=Mycoplasmopsis equigenitalium TaxID=114883 RepID=A0ABY5J146_9BACT|nr:M17 family metallopeptidase [Mycoplasmopsis equigenitalium]UUD36977.1 M17 family metallopeptidase [Mycoplasmopsis equigenitalium]VEU69727.1 Cytosol aminopeptidase [Mycoplasmopsis californica]